MAGTARSTIARPRCRARTRRRWVIAVMAGFLASATVVAAVPDSQDALAASDPPPVDWTLRVGTNRANAIATDLSGNVIVTVDGAVVKYSPSGQRLWSTSSPDADHVAVDSMGDIVVTGPILDDDEVIGGFMAKYSPSGGLRWTRPIGDFPSAMATTPTNDVVTVGSVYDGATIGSGANSVKLSGGGAYVAVFSPVGVLRWAKWCDLGGPWNWLPVNDRVRDVVVDPEGNIIVGGTLRTDRTLYYGQTQKTLDSIMFLTKYNPTGTKLWALRTVLDSVVTSQYSPRYVTSGLGGLAVDDLGNIAITGAFNGTRTFGSGSNAESLTSVEGTVPGLPDVFIASYTGSGALRWVQQIKARYDDHGSSIAITPDRGVGVAGWVNLSGGTFADFLASYGPTGELRWAVLVADRSLTSMVLPRAATFPGPDVVTDRLGGLSLSGEFSKPLTVPGSGADITITPTDPPDGYLLHATVGGAAPGGGYVALSPVRLLDTRGDGVTVDGGFARGGLRSAGSTLELQVTGRGGVPSTALAVVLNVTATGAQSNGFVTVFPCGGTRPNASNLNVQPGVSVPNLVIAKVGSGGKVCVYTHAAMHLIADVNGFVPAGSPYVPLVPARLLDTRGDGVTVDGKFARGGIRAAGSTLELPVAGRGGVPADGRAVVLNVTAAGAQGNGFVTVFPCGTTRPNASSVNFRPGVAVPNAVVAKVGSGGKVCVYTHQATELIVDVNGHHPPASVFTSLSPARLLDTRGDGVTVDATFQRGGIRPAGSTLALQVTGRGGVPAGASAVVLNVTATGAQANGFVTVFPCGTTRPNASNVNFRPGISIPNAVIAKIGTSGQVCLYTHQATQLVVDVNGYHP
jgi:hypothetical protein